MKNAVLYARVSSELQKKEKTVDSQVLELRRQIEHDGNTLVKEYIDEGYSGAQLDRPAMDELRSDMKTDLFETIYVLNTDRIAREVTYQIIIIAEILKNRKQVIINGVDYIHNPENKFTLTVLGAVAELERAKITERVVRGKALKLAQGCHSGRGSLIFGYDYTRKTPTKEGYFTVNEKEADTVRAIFNYYTTTNLSMALIAENIYKDGHLTKHGKSNWNRTNIANILRNEAYMGTMYFNKIKVVTEYANPMFGTVKTSTKYIHRDKSEWVSISIPPIIPKELFEKTQEHITLSTRLTNKITRVNGVRVRPERKVRIELLSNLLICGTCGIEYYVLKRNDNRPLKRDPNNVYTFIEYMCESRYSKSKERCPTKQIVSHLIEDKIWNMFSTIITNPEILKTKLSVPSKSVEKYCEVVRSDYEQCIDFDTRRNFLLKYVSKIIHYENDTFTVSGNVHGLEFMIEDSITAEDRHHKRLSAIGAITASQRKKMREGLEVGKSYSISQGILSGGFTVLGYDYIHKTKTSRSKLVINEQEAHIVRTVFNEYIKSKEATLRTIGKSFEKAGYLTKRNKKNWDEGTISGILKNYSYTGTMYFNKTKVLPRGGRAPNGNPRPANISARQDKSKWTGIPVPEIISKELFDKAQEKLEENRKGHRRHLESYLLGDLIVCGICGSKYSNFSYSYKRALARDPNHVYCIDIYVCTHRQHNVLTNGKIKCTNKRVTTHLIEEKVWDIVTNDLLDPETLRIKTQSPEHVSLSTVDFSVRRFCYNLQMEIEECNNFIKRRRLLTSCVDKIVHDTDTITLYGSIPVEKSNTEKIEFRIKRMITVDDRHRKRLAIYKKVFLNKN